MSAWVVYHRRIILSIIILLLQYRSFAQLSAAFTASPVAGCSPIVVQFTDQSAGNPAQWKWDLGNGVISFLQNPSTTYFTPGTYNVKLVVRNGNNADSIIKSQYIHVFPGPEINFTASDTVGCFPLTVQFTDLSTSGNGSVANWLWDFGDGSTSSQPNPAHTYTTSGNFTVALKITNTNGCFKILSRPQYIEVMAGVVSNFTNTTPALCAVPAVINFTNTSTGPGSLNYTWDFGDGTGTNVANPVHVYTSAGTYTVILVTESSQGCRDSLIKTNLISVGAIASHFNSPDSVCLNQSFTITNTSTPSPSNSHWDFGDGTTSTDINPVKTYTSPGTFIIKLVNGLAGCSDSTTKPIVVRPGPTADFSANPTQSCQLPFPASFTNLSSGNGSYLWNFGDGATSTQTNPVHNYTVAGTYSVTLMTTNGTGCTDTIVKTDYIQLKQPSVTLENLPQQGCVPVTIAPTLNFTSSEPATTFLWNFGDGTTSTEASPIHTYVTAGTYTVSLTITTSGGCTATTVLNNAVKAGNKPQAAFTLQPNDVCAQVPINFTDNSTGSPDQWLWQFGDGITSIVQNPQHTYEEIGDIPVTLVVWSNGCADTITHNVIIRPPVASFRFNNNCSNKYQVDFIDQSLGALTWTWNFGDGVTSTDQSPTHVYAAPGTYLAILDVTNENCVYSTYRTVEILDEEALFNADHNTICNNTIVHFNGVDINAANITSWLWDFGDGDTSNTPSAASHSFTTAGTYSVTLTITDILGCADMHSLPVTVFGPKAGFSPATPAECFGSGPMLFNDSSASDASHPIVKWIWNYGDGVIDSTSAPPYQHNYTTGGDYAVSLTVVDNYGCRDSIRKNPAVIIAQPDAAFHSNDSLSCTDRPVGFINTSTGHELQYSWDFGDGSASTAINPVHYYSNTGQYTVTLLVTDQYGCRDSLTKTAYINISFPKASFTMSDSFSTCPPLQVSFTSSSTNYANLRWDFGDGNNSDLSNPSHVYTYPGIYLARLVATGPGGCKDSVYKQIEVRGPRGNFVYGPLDGCKPLTVSFTASTIDRLSFLWDFSDGTTIPTTDSVLSHVYSFAGNYVPKMILEDITGCQVPIVGRDTIRVIGIDTRFGLHQGTLCDSGFVSFHDSTTSNDPIVSWQWNFGDGGSSNQQNPVHHYTSPGIYNVTFSVTSARGCTDSRSLNDTIKIFASPHIVINGDTSACVPAQLHFSGQVLSGDPSLLNWQWSFGNGNTSPLPNPSQQSYSTPGSFTINATVTDNHGCRDVVSKTINVHPLPNTDAGPDAMICLGSSTQLHAIGAFAYSWTALPGLSCTNCPDPFASPADKTTYLVTGSSEFGCIKKDSVIINVQKPFVLQVSPDDTICTGESTRLLASGADQYSWSPSAGLDNANIASPRASPSSSTLYTLTAKDSLHCFTDTKAVSIKVYPIPTVEAGDDQTIIVGNNVQLHAIASADVVLWRWRPAFNLSCANCADPVAAPKKTTQYTLEVRNEGGCVTKDLLTIYVNCNNGELFIPNTFSPNGDGMNDRFYPRSKGGSFIVRSMRVFNRWGELVFEKLNFAPNDASTGWDGKYKGKLLAPDVFVYTMEIQCENNETITYSGDVTLIQ